ncbi:MAG: glycerophosphodiester phosphodiesterase family protein [Desulfobacterales bacterium]
MKGSIVKRNLAAAALAAAAALLAFAAPAMSQALPGPSAAKPPEKPLVVGHRGAAGLMPENTLAAFKRGCEPGIDAIELDVLMSADGQLVVHHDFRLKPEIARTADGAWIGSGSPPAINALSLAQIKAYDVGRLQPKSSYAARFPWQTPVDGERIPTLKEVIDLFKQSCHPPTRLFVEIKTSPEEPSLTPPPEAVSERVVALLRGEGIAERTWVLSFDWRSLTHIQKTAPELMTVHLTIVSPGLNNLKPNQFGASPWLAGLDVDDFGGSAPRAVKAAGGRVWSPHYRNLTPQTLAEARQLGLLVSVWTPDTPEDLKRMIAMGVDAITTNRPDLLKKLLDER